MNMNIFLLLELFLFLPPANEIVGRYCFQSRLSVCSQGTGLPMPQLVSHGSHESFLYHLASVDADNAN